ncbi:MAG: hypothetical protein HY936_01685 [Nitrosomonadales bacterium]|nr:hypothetical protein [Nitrosomonadales bacterium]
MCGKEPLYQEQGYVAGTPVDGMGNIHLTAALQKRLEFADKNLHVEVLPQNRQIY